MIFDSNIAKKKMRSKFLNDPINIGLKSPKKKRQEEKRVNVTDLMIPIKEKKVQES